MMNPLSWGRRNVLFLALPACLLSLVFTGPRDSTRVSKSSILNRGIQVPSSPAVIHQGRFHDWSTRHVLYPQLGTMAALESARKDPRALFRWREVEQRQPASRLAPGPLRDPRSFAIFGRRGRPLPGRFPDRSASVKRDWSINLGTAGTAPTMYPAKFTFDITATPSCANDFVVFPINAVSSATQPNIVAFNNLYSGTAGGNGLCNRTASGTDDGVSATVLWSYNVHAIAAGAAVPASPVLSQDGTKVAFVESATGNPAHFHVLAWKSGDGQAANKQNVLVPKAITVFSATAPAAASGAATDLSFGTTTDTLSSPYIDYAADTAYVGNDAGILFRFKNVFCTNASCGTAVPSLDLTWGSGTGSVTVCSGKKMTGPVQNVYNQKIYVGCSDGKLYSIDSAGTTVTSITVGDGTTFGGIVDPPLVDGINGFVYAVSGSSAGGTGVLVQAKVDFSSSVTATIGLGNACNLHSPTPNNAYFTNITSAGALMYVGGTSTTGTVPAPCASTSNGSATVVLYAVTFGAAGVMTSGAPAHSIADGGGPGYEWAPLSEFFNATTGIDWLFFAALQSGQPNISSANITAGFPATFTAPVKEGVGTSGMVVDNQANTTAFRQSASFYFNALQQNAACNNNTNGQTGGCAVKLTQAALQ